MFGKKNDDSIGPSKGIMKWINRFFRFILYPFIHPKFFLFLLLVAVAAVVVPWKVYHIEFADIPQWYGETFGKHFQKFDTVISPVKEKVLQKYDEMTSDYAKTAAEAKNKKQEDIVEYDVQAQAQRPTFQNDDNYEAPVAEDNLTKPAEEIAPEEVAPQLNNTFEIQQPVAETSEVYFKRDDSLGLTYLNKPEKISGRFAVINANEVLVNSSELFLYGIYTPAGINNRNASAYMLKHFDGKNVDCYIGAYTSDNHATAICLYEGKSINHELVNQGFAQNVSLY